MPKKIRSFDELRRQAEERVRAHHQDPLKIPPGQLPVILHELEVHQIELEMQNEELQRNYMELEQSRDRYAELFDYAPVGYLILDADGRIVKGNHICAGLLGVPRDQLFGKALYQFCVMENRDTLYRHLRQVFRYQSQQSCDVKFITGEGPRFLAKLDSVMQSSAEVGGSPRCLTLIRDITESKKAELAIRKAKETAEKISREKSHFLAAASHDLRQPLQAMTTINDLLKKSLKDKEALDLVYKLSESLVNMTELFNALLNVSQLESGTITPKITEFPVDQVLRRIDTAYRELAEKKGLRLRVAMSTAVVRSDPVLLKQILDNLVSNAIHYTKTGSILIGCRYDRSHLRIEVWDTGIGIPEDKIEYIFDDFFQINNPARNYDEGLGLGLSIAARSASLLRSEIKQKTWHSGSLFSVSLPLVPVKRIHGKIPVSQQAGTQVASGLSLLVVEDNALVLLALTSLFKVYGYKVTEATSISEALSKMEDRSKRFDCIITDYLLENGETGLELIKKIRQLSGKNIPGLIFTGNLELVKKSEINTLGLRVLEKPVTAEILHKNIKEMTFGGQPGLCLTPG